ncbi:MAG: hypothetical protein M0Z76_05905 [Gammaproteobacteria bacterium]|nr:hypothetical protein [Gammaproteobacteria bacterium]
MGKVAQTAAIGLVAALGSVCTPSAVAGQQAALQMTRAGDKPYVFVAAPRESGARGRRDYGPIAAFLTKVLDHKVIYRHPDGWITYESWIWTDHADIYFDGPQFMDWRLRHLDQTLGPRVPQSQDWRLYTWKGSPVHTVQQAAAGQILCAPPFPNWGSLWVMSYFKDPVRQPYLRNVRGWKAIFHAVRAHTCTLGIGPRLSLHYLDPQHKGITIIQKGPHLPNQGFTISARLPLALREKIVQALLSPAGQQAMRRLRRRFAHGHKLVPGDAAAYRGADRVLEAQWRDVYGSEIRHDVAEDIRREHLPVSQARAQQAVGNETADFVSG